jgi:hypothetical protein
VFIVCFDVKAESATSETLRLFQWLASNMRKQCRLYTGLTKRTRYHSGDLLPTVTCDNTITHGGD